MHTVEQIDTFDHPNDSREVKVVHKQDSVVSYHKAIEDVTFKDGKKGYYVSLSEEAHDKQTYEDGEVNEAVTEKVIDSWVFEEDQLDEAWGKYDEDYQ